MNGRMLKVLSLALMLALLLSCIPAFAATVGSNQMQINNNTGASITEVYIYPNYNSRVGDARNKGWIKNQESGIVTLTSTEARRDCLWNMTVVFKQKNGRSFRVTWEDLDMSYYLGETVEFTVTGDGYYNMSIINDYGTISFNFYNDTGYILTEVYFFAENSTTWGQMRNNKEINDQNQIRINFNSAESNSNTNWTLHVLLREGRQLYYVEFEGINLRDYDGGTMMLSVNRYGELYIENYTGNV